MLSTAEEDLLAGKIPTQQENKNRQEPILPTSSRIISSQEAPNPLTRGNGKSGFYDVQDFDPAESYPIFVTKNMHF
jgi:hypothetical protein